MKPFLFIFLFFAFVNTKELEPNKAHIKEYKVSDIISLIKKCETIGYKIIDPDDYIKKDDEQNLEKHLREIYRDHKIVTFIIIFHGAYLKDEKNNIIDYTNYTQIIENEIYAQNIVNKKVPIIISVTSIDEKEMNMKTHGSVSNIISEQDCFTILEIVKNYFSYGEYSYGMVELGKLINYYLTNTSFFSRNKKFFYMLILLVSCFCFCYLLSIILQKIKDRRNMRLTMSDEEKLLKIKDFLKRTKVDRKILSDNCIICLEPFDNCISITHSIVNASHKHKTINNDDENKNGNININDIININENSYQNNLIDTFNDTNVNSNTDIQIEMQNINNDNNDNNDIIENNNIVYDDNENNIPRNTNGTQNQISTLPCGHRYHVKCITEWMLQKKNICPMCREKINVDIPSDNDDDIVDELLNIQIELHPVFALLVFQTINDELTWGAITLPVLNGGFFGWLGSLFSFI